MASLIATLLRAYVIWGLLIGQLVLYAVAWHDIGIISHPWGLERMVGILAVSGLVGLVGEWLWRSRYDPDWQR